MARFRRIAALALCFALLAGCGRQAASSASQAASSTSSASAASGAASVPEQSAGAPTALVLGYTPSAGFNPYTTSSNLVEQNAGLLFECLVELSPELSLEYRLADSIVSAGETVTIHIRSGCTFADGTPVTAQDAAASLEAARVSERYAARFAGVTEVKAEGDTVTVTLASPDSMFAYLCDIPVLKAAETGAAQPTPNGRYTYGDSGSLVRNNSCAFAENGPDTIYLTEVSSYEEMVSGFAVGSLNLYTASDSAQTSAGFSSVSDYYKTNNLVFLGVNATPPESGTKSPLLTTAAGRALLSQLIDRTQIAQKSYYARAYPATGCINDHYDCVADSHVIQSTAEVSAEQAAADLAALGYTLDAAGYYQDADGQRVNLRLLVYSGNTYKRYAASLIKDQLAAAGLYVTVEEASDFDVYSQKVASGDFDLYIGEVKLYNNMDMSPFFEGGQASVGIVQSEALAAAYTAFKADQNTAGALETAFAAEMPFVPLVWRNGTVVHSSGISGLSCSISNVFYSLEGLRFDAAE